MGKRTAPTQETLRKARDGQVSLFLKTFAIDSERAAGHLTSAMEMTATLAINDEKENS